MNFILTKQLQRHEMKQGHGFWATSMFNEVLFDTPQRTKDTLHDPLSFLSSQWPGIGQARKGCPIILTTKVARG